MNYKLINRITSEETMCSKVVIDGFDYYVSDEELKEGDYVIEDIGGVVYGPIDKDSIVENPKKVIATNNPSIDLPEVVNELDNLTFEEFRDWSFGESGPWHTYKMFQKGYSKSQESHPYSEEDMIEFAAWLRSDPIASACSQYRMEKGNGDAVSTEELLQTWKEQKPKTVYYE